MEIVNIVDVDVATEGRVLTFVIEYVQSYFIELTIIFPEVGFKAIEGIIGETELIHEVERAAHFTVA
jgi:hypothetical protein